MMTQRHGVPGAKLNCARTANAVHALKTISMFQEAAEMNGPMWNWFGLSYSSYLVLPRALLCGMPEPWQEQMVKLLDEMRETYDPNQIEDDYHIALRDGRGRFKKDPLANYRHPPKLPYASDLSGTRPGGSNE